MITLDDATAEVDKATADLSQLEAEVAQHAVEESGAAVTSTSSATSDNSLEQMFYACQKVVHDLHGSGSISQQSIEQAETHMTSLLNGLQQIAQNAQIPICTTATPTSHSTDLDAGFGTESSGPIRRRTVGKTYQATPYMAPSTATDHMMTGVHEEEEETPHLPNGLSPTAVGGA